MTETGRVTKIEGDRVTLFLETDAACAECGPSSEGKQKEGCAGCIPLGGRDKRSIVAINRKTLQLATGDRVEVLLDSRNAIVAGFMFFIFPLILFLGAYGIMSALFPLLAEALRVVISLGGFVLAYLFVILWRYVRKTKDWPEVIAKCKEPTLPVE